MKKGFTLAEILITLGIIGVITAITMPILSTATQDKANANRLTSTVTDLENAFGILLAQTDSEDLLTQVTDPDDPSKTADVLRSTNFNTDIARYMKTAGAGNTIANEYGSASPFKGTDGRTFTVTADSVLKLKNGALVFLHKNSSAANADANGNVDRYYGDLVIDVNGNKNPNKVNKDVFVYHLGTDGMLYRNSVTVNP